jgi:elongation of very long chain fatty acids protein 6
MVANNYVLPVASIVIYLLFIYFGTKIMKNCKPFKLDNSLAAWNLFLSIFSAWGMIRMVPHTLWLLSSKPFEETVCEPAHTLYGGGAAGLAVQMFCLSKIPELIDTVYIVLRKKPLIFLHWCANFL